MKTENPKLDAMKILNWLTDRGAMFAAIIVSLGTVTLMFVVITPDILIYRIIMGTMGAILVLFSPRALAKRKFGIWRCIAILIIFAEVSTVLTMTDTQSTEATTKTIVIDPVHASLQASTQTARDNLTKNIDQQAIANTRATIDGLVEQFKILSVIYNAAVDRESAYRPAGSSQIGGIDPNKLFMAIPSAIVSLQLARYMTLVFSLIVAIVFQAVVFATVVATVKQIKRDGVERVPAKKKSRNPRKPKAEPSVDHEPVTEVNFVKEEPTMLDVN